MSKKDDEKRNRARDTDSAEPSGRTAKEEESSLWRLAHLARDVLDAGETSKDGSNEKGRKR